MAGPMVQYYASAGIRIDEKSIKDVDKFLSRIESKLGKSVGKKGLQVNLFIDEAKFHKHLQGVMSRVGKGNPLKLSNVTVDPVSVSKSIRETLGKAQFRAPITAVLSRASLTTLRAQVAGALQGLPINVRVGNVSQRGGGSGTGAESARRRASLTGRGDPSLQEFLMGKPERSSLSAGNRRYVDAIVGKSFGGVGGNSLTGMAVQGGLGGLARVGSSSLMGRMAGMAGMALGGPMGGAMGMVMSGVLSLAGSAFTGIWSTLGSIVTAPFQLISSAASAVTGAFYRIALAATPLVFGFNAIDKRVRQSTMQGVALNQAVKDYGSTGKQERDWLMNMANNSGAEYSALVEPYTTFISASAPAMGLSQSKGIFEALTQYGTTHGANTFSMNNALKAFGQMSAKGTVQLEELKNQVGDAMGFGGMMPIFAEAWQQLQGRTGANKLTGQKALDELLKATEKRQVIASKILPLVEKIAREKSADSIATMRESSQGQRALFMNQLSGGWQKFTEGGGESGLKFFWKTLQKFGDWWEENGATLGKYFEATMYFLDGLRLAAMEFWKFATTGEETAITEWMKTQGINVDLIRENVITGLKAIGDIFTQLSQVSGFEQNGSLMEGLAAKVTNFTKNLNAVLASVADMLRHINIALDAFRQYKNMTVSEQVAAFIPGTAPNKVLSTGIYSSLASVGSVAEATIGVVGAGKDLAIGNAPRPTVQMPGEYERNIAQIPTAWGSTTPQGIADQRKREQIIWQKGQIEVNVNLTGSEQAIAALSNTTNFTKADFNALLSKNIAAALVQAPKQ